MDESPVPVVVGSHGLTGRQQIIRVPDPELLEDETVEIEGVYVNVPASTQPSKAIPPNCIRVLSSPLPIDRGGGCRADCPGLQKDGGCLAEIVKAANTQGVDWSFALEREGERWWWVYAGPPVDVPDLSYPGGEPVATTHTFKCPHCRKKVEQDVGNWWCPKCGKNANDPK